MDTQSDSLESIIAKMKGQSVTAGWDAVLYYNRGMTNHVLEQEYIDRVTVGTWWDPLTLTIPKSGSPESIYLEEAVFSEPLISFKSQEQYQVPVLNVTWFLKSGSYTRFDGADVLFEAEFNPLMGPTLTCNVPVSKGKVEEGVVYLDLNDAAEFYFNFSEDDTFNREGAEYMNAALISALTDEQKRIVISEIVNTEGQVWNPSSFKINVMTAPENTNRASANYNDGAVVVYVGLDDNEPGGTPVDDLYMIPSDGDYTAAIVLSNKAMMEKILSKGFQTMSNDGVGQYELLEASADQGIYSLASTAGKLLVRAYEWIGEGDYLMQFDPVSLPFASAIPELSNAVFNISVSDEGINMEWNGYTEVESRFRVYYDLIDLKNELNWRKKMLAKFVTRSDTEVVIQVDEDFQGSDFLVPKLELGNNMLERWEGITKNYLDASVEVDIEAALSRFASVIPVFNTFALQNILFRNNNVVGLHTVRTPGDLVVFGKFRPEVGKLAILNPMAKVLAGETYTFEVDPSAAGLKLNWALEPLADRKGRFAEDVGTIDKNTGVYTAPSTLEGDFIQAKITVVDEQSEATRSVALLTVFNVFIQVIPKIFKCDFDGKFSVRAAAHDKAPLTCTLVEESTSKVEQDGLIDDLWMFTAGPAPLVDPEDPDSGTLGYLIEELVFGRQGSGTETRAYAVCLSKNQALALHYEPQGTNTVQFIATTQDKPVDCTWTKLVGSGEIDPDTGIYTIDPTSEDLTVVILADFMGLFSSVDIFTIDVTGKSISCQIRAGNPPLVALLDVEALKRQDEAKRRSYIK